MKFRSVHKLLAILLCCMSIHSAFCVDTHACYDLFADKTILILGGTGYLGSGLAQEILKYDPKRVVIFSRDEVKQFKTAQQFVAHPNVQMTIGDIRDYDSLSKAMMGVDIVIHCAALKRIDLIETNVEEAIKTNIISSLHVFNAAVANKVSQVLFISTDKACLPINAYGACKFVSEKVFTNYDPNKFSTCFLAVRFGNILESTGSVIPFFIDKIKKGEPIPLTDPEMTRFIIGKEEAFGLIFDALYYGQGGEIFTKKLPAMRVSDLIDVLRETYQASSAIQIVGLRPGEKLHELLINESELPRTIEFNGYYIITSSVTKVLRPSQRGVPAYLNLGHPVMSGLQQEYSSNCAVVSKDALATLLKTLKIL